MLATAEGWRGLTRDRRRRQTSDRNSGLGAEWDSHCLAEAESLGGLTEDVHPSDKRTK